MDGAKSELVVPSGQLDVDLWALDEVHFQQYGSRCRMWVPPEIKDPVLFHEPTRKKALAISEPYDCVMANSSTHGKKTNLRARAAGPSSSNCVRKVCEPIDGWSLFSTMLSITMHFCTRPGERKHYPVSSSTSCRRTALSSIRSNGFGNSPAGFACITSIFRRLMRYAAQ